MPPLTTWLIRHGQSTANAGLPTTDAAEAPLTDLGREQARAAAARVDRRPDLVIVSPFRRAIETAAPILERWPDTPRQTWPIQEVTYLSPEVCVGTTVAMRRPMVEDFWARADPAFVHGPGAELFAGFVDRLRDFHDRLARADDGFVLAVGHGQFFRAFAHGLERGFEVSPDWMRGYRAAEIAAPMINGEAIELAANAFKTL